MRDVSREAQLSPLVRTRWLSRSGRSLGYV
jgi:hypothetical protein